MVVCHWSIWLHADHDQEEIKPSRKQSSRDMETKRETYAWTPISTYRSPWPMRASRSRNWIEPCWTDFHRKRILAERSTRCIEGEDTKKRRRWRRREHQPKNSMHAQHPNIHRQIQLDSKTTQIPNSQQSGFQSSWLSDHTVKTPLGDKNSNVVNNIPCKCDRYTYTGETCRKWRTRRKGRWREKYV